MIDTKLLIAGASLIAQAVFFIGSVFLVFDLFSLANIITPEIEKDASLLIPYIRETVASYRLTFGIGVIGAIVSYAIYSMSDFRASWYLKGTRVIAWLWLPFVPIGTVIGIVLLAARRSAIESASDDRRSSANEPG